MASLQQAAFNILSLPDEILEKILSYLDYDTTSHCRIICCTFDHVCQQLLNQGFIKVDKYHGKIQRRIKSQLPRRESERRNHPLARHVDILAAVETRLSLLSMTYTKYIDSGLCCFIPGKVLDELFMVLTYLEKNLKPPRAHELLQELRDISSMAMEHFDEKIAPGLKKQIPPLQLSLNTSLPSTSSFSHSPTTLTLLSPPLGHHGRIPGMRTEMSQVKHSMRTIQSSVVTVRKDLTECRHKITENKKKVTEVDKKLVEQCRLNSEQAVVIAEQGRKLEEQDKQISDLNRKVAEYNQKFVDLMSDIARVLTDNKDAKAELVSVINRETAPLASRKGRALESKGTMVHRSHRKRSACESKGSDKSNTYLPKRRK